MPTKVFTQNTPIETIGFKEQLRTEALRNFDTILSWTFNQSHYPYQLKIPLQTTTYQITSPDILSFTEKYGFFSDTHPLISKVTNSPQDLALTLQFLLNIHLSLQDDSQKQLLTHEVLAKVVAYRDLSLAQTIPLPCRHNRLITYRVDHIFDLGNGMPAYGLLPEQTDLPPILLFRGTDVSFLSERGLASMVSDLDPKGPGLTVFLQSQPLLHDWLTQVATTYPKTKLIGCSLGGALATYTYLYEYPLISDNPQELSTIFNPPGISNKIYKIWTTLPGHAQLLLNVYVTQGDLIPKIGKLVGTPFELSTNRLLHPISAHVTLITAEPRYNQNPIDLRRENQSQRFTR